MRRVVLGLTLLLAWGCGGDADPSAGSSATSGGMGGATSTVTASQATTASSGGGGAAPTVPLDGYGAISGSCGVLDPSALMGGAGAQKIDNAIDFGATAFDTSLLSTGGQKVMNDGNLGGSSLHSEAIAFEVLHRCELAALIATEGEIAYVDDGGKKTDLVVEIDGVRVGVSVTRGIHFPPDTPYTLEQARALLDDKLGDVLLSSANVNASDGWSKQILAIVAREQQHVDQLAAAYPNVDAAVRADTIVIVTRTDGEDTILYD